MSDKLGILFIGAMGSVATTVMAGVISIRKELSPTVGLLTETLPFVNMGLVPLENIVFGGWDIRGCNVYDCSIENKVIPVSLLDDIKSDLMTIKVLPGTIRGAGPRILQMAVNNSVLSVSSCRQIIAQLVLDIQQFRSANNLDNLVVVNTASVDWNVPLSKDHQTVQDFEEALNNNSDSITPGMLYAYSAILSDCHYVNFTSERTIDVPALSELASTRNIIVAGKDGKTGQTLYKSILASMLKIRRLKLDGWFSTNLLGNRDGMVLRDPIHSESKIASKSGVLSEILGYNDFVHEIRIEFYPPRGDSKEAWDTIDFQGWLGERMSMKIVWEGKDSILAAPLIVDLVRLVELAYRKKKGGILKEMGLFFKSPYGSITSDVFEQYQCLVDYFLHGS